MAEVTGMRSNALPYPCYGLAYYVTFPLLDADGDPISPSSPDSEVSKNGDTFADCANEATEIATSSGICYLLLTAAEMTADIVTVQIKSTGAKTTVLTLYPRKLVALTSGTCQGSNDTGDIQLASGDSAIDDYYNGCLVVAVIDGATEARIINDYVGSTKVAEVSPAWQTAQPDADDTYTIYLPEGRQVGQANVTHAAGTAWGSGAITAGSIATAAFTNAKFAVGAFEGAWEFDLDSVMFAGGTAGDYVKRVIADTDELQVDWTNGGRLDSLIDAIKAKTDNLPPDPADASDIAASFATVNSTLATIASYIDTEIGTLLTNVAALPTAAQNATAVLTTQMTEAYAADGVAPTLAQSQFLLIAALTEFAISGTTITCKKLDGSTTAATYTLDSASAPTSRTRAS